MNLFHKSFYTFLLFLLALSGSYSQSYEYSKGTLELSSGLEKQGYIFDTDLDILSANILFKENLDAVEEIINTESIKKIRLEDNTYLEKYHDKKSNRDFLLLKLLEGEVALFKYQNNGKSRFLVKKDHNYYPISNKVRKPFDIGTYYRGVLTILLSDWQGLDKKLYSTSYSENQLKNLLNAYNTSKKVPAQKLKRNKQSYLGVQVGMHQNRIYFLFKNPIEYRITGLRSSAFGGLFVERKMAKNVSSQIGLNYIKFEGSLRNIGPQDITFKDDFDVSFTYLSIPIQLNYYVIDRDVKLSIIGIIEYNHLVKQTFKISSSLLRTEKDFNFPYPDYKLRTNFGAALTYKGFFVQALICYGIGYSGIQPMIATWGNQVSFGNKMRL